MKKELYHKYRPQQLKKVLGQSDVITMLRKLLKKGKMPHALILSGMSGVGKTTIARILAKLLNCNGGDLTEVNSASFRGIDTIRDIGDRINLAPMFGDTRVWIIDECHNLTKAAQEAFLKLLEDMPDHVYLMLCTTEPNKLIAAVRTRCTDVKLNPLKDEDLTTIIEGVLVSEDTEIHQEVKDKIIEVSHGSARKALVILHQVLDEEDTEKQLELVQSVDTEKDAIEIARYLANAPYPNWTNLCKILRKCNIDEAEGIRRLVLAYVSKMALSGGPGSKRAVVVIDYFSANYFDSGKAGLILSCYSACEALKGGKK